MSDLSRKKGISLEEFKKILERNNAAPNERTGIEVVYKNIKQRNGIVTIENAKLVAATIVAQDPEQSW